MIELLILFFLLAFIGGIIFSRRDRFQPPGTKRANEGTFRAFEKVDSLFVNVQEVNFFHALHTKLPSQYFLHSKVRLEDIIRVRSDIRNERMRWHLRARVKSRHVDFLITDQKGRPLCAVELDGASHTGVSSQNADALKDGIFKAVNILLIRVSTGENFENKVDEIVKELSAF